MDSLTGVINMAAIHDLRKLQKPGRPSLLAELIDMFFNLFEADFIQLRNFVDQKDLKGISAKAHSLKSNAANLGATKLTELLLRVEMIANGDLPKESFELLVAQIAIEYEKAKDALEVIRRTYADDIK